VSAEGTAAPPRPEVVSSAPTIPMPTTTVVPPAPHGGHRRSRGLDVLRGVTVAWLIVIVHTPTMGWRGHAAWWGWDHSDVYFPAFLFIAGAGLAHQTRDKAMPWPRLVRRFVTLVVLGLLVNAWLGSGADVRDLRIPGVLQRIAVVGLAGAVVAWAARRRWTATLAAAVVLAVGWSLLLWHGGASCEDGLPTNDGCGTYLDVDVALFGESHVYHEGRFGHDPEGAASTLGALATFLAGYSATRLLARRHRLRDRVTTCLALAAGWAVLALPLLALQPLNKRLWTGSFVAANAAGCLVALAVLVAVLDPARGRVAAAVAWPFEALGRNALVLWIGVFVGGKVLEATIVADGEPLGRWFLAQHGAAWYLVAFGGGWVAIAAAMHAGRWYVRL
jgi:heparan-alpha-glucosaminide N-acetyltransferase